MLPELARSVVSEALGLHVNAMTRRVLMSVEKEQ